MLRSRQPGRFPRLRPVSPVGDAAWIHLPARNSGECCVVPYSTSKRYRYLKAPACCWPRRRWPTCLIAPQSCPLRRHLAGLRAGRRSRPLLMFRALWLGVRKRHYRGGTLQGLVIGPHLSRGRSGGAGHLAQRFPPWPGMSHGLAYGLMLAMLATGLVRRLCLSAHPAPDDRQYGRRQFRRFAAEDCRS